MLKMNVKFLEGQSLLRTNDYSRMSLDEIYSYMFYEAELIIKNDEMIFFDEEIAVIEFYWYLVKWYSEYLKGSIKPFVYSTVEYVEPILVFSLQQNNLWKIDSIWKKCDDALTIESKIFNYEISELINKIELNIIKHE